MTFVKGVSGNPRGPIPKDRTMQRALEAALALKNPDGTTNRQAIAQTVVELAKRGNLDAIKHVWERMDGKVKDEQAVDHAGTIAIEVTYSRRPADPPGAAGAAPGPAADQG